MDSIKNASKVKAIFTDLDNTLWDGILAEKDQLNLREDYYNFLKEMYAKGILLVIVSRNDKDDVIEAFKKLGVDEGLFTAVVANWDPKYLNIEKLIRYLELRPETVVFIDDNPLEREEVQKGSPEVMVIADGEWAEVAKNEYVQSKERQAESEIKTRINRYKTVLSASEQQGEYEEDEEFLRSLNRKVSVGKIDVDNLDRFTRLLVDTHRINFNPGKFAEYDEALDYLHSKINKNFELYAVSAYESDLSLGLIGAMVVEISEQRAVVTDATFSCGIIGRGFEGKAIIVLGEMLKGKGVDRLDVFVKLTETNSRVREILQELGFEEVGRSPEEGEDESSVVKFSVGVEEIVSSGSYDWIGVSDEDPEFDYPGIPSVVKFFENKVKPIIQDGFRVLNLGSARGEVLGLHHKNSREAFNSYLDDKEVVYTPVDIEYYPEEENVVADAENLKGVVGDKSQDLVMAIELLEHSEHFWKIINEIIRVTDVGGYIFITVPNFSYPKHEYPIDLWRIGPETLRSFFPEEHFEIIELIKEGQQDKPRRSMILAKKLDDFEANYEMPRGGQTDWSSGLTIFK